MVAVLNYSIDHVTVHVHITLPPKRKTFTVSPISHVGITAKTGPDIRVK